MPCYDPDDDLHRAAKSRDELFREFRHNSPVAEHLCEAMQILIKHNLTHDLSDKTMKWWKEHRRRDEKKNK